MHEAVVAAASGYQSPILPLVLIYPDDSKLTRYLTGHRKRQKEVCEWINALVLHGPDSLKPRLPLSWVCNGLKTPKQYGTC